MPAPAGQRPSGKFATIEAGRGVAALLVLLFHAGAAIFPAAKYWNTPVFGGVFAFGYAGVDFFFVLSGFIIWTVHRHDIDRPDRLKHYAIRRLVRIYPPYWLVLLPVMVATLAMYRLPGAAALTLRSVILLGPNLPTMLAVAWTLYHEVAFYSVFGLWIVSWRLGAAASLLWLGDVFAGLAGHPVGLAYLGSSVNLLFLFGVSAALLSGPDRRPVPAAVAWLAAIGFVGLGLENVYAPVVPDAVRQLLYGVLSAVWIATMVSRERRQAVAVPRFLAALGAASYSIYLVHFPVLSFLAKLAVASGLQRTVDPDLAFVVVVALTLAAGFTFHRFAERPLLRALTRSDRRGDSRLATS